MFYTIFLIEYQLYVLVFVSYSMNNFLDSSQRFVIGTSESNRKGRIHLIALMWCAIETDLAFPFQIHPACSGSKFHGKSATIQP